MIEFKHNEQTGILEVWKDGVHIGEVLTMGDEILHNKPNDNHQDNNGKG